MERQSVELHLSSVFNSDTKLNSGRSGTGAQSASASEAGSEEFEQLKAEATHNFLTPLPAPAASHAGGDSSGRASTTSLLFGFHALQPAEPAAEELDGGSAARDQPWRLQRPSATACV